MSRNNVNLTISVVEAEAENLLHSYPYYPYQQAFAVPSLRQKLIAYVLSRIPHLYAVIEAQELSTDELLHCPPEQRQQIETLIHCGIRFLLTPSLSKIAIETVAYADREEMNGGSISSQHSVL